MKKSVIYSLENTVYIYWFCKLLIQNVFKLVVLRWSVAAINKRRFHTYGSSYDLQGYTEHQNGAAKHNNVLLRRTQQQRFCLSCVNRVEALSNSKNRSMAGSASLYDSLLLSFPHNNTLRRYSVLRKQWGYTLVKLLVQCGVSQVQVSSSQVAFFQLIVMSLRGRGRSYTERPRI